MAQWLDRTSIMSVLKCASSPCLNLFATYTEGRNVWVVDYWLETKVQ